MARTKNTSRRSQALRPQRATFADGMEEYFTCKKKKEVLCPVCQRSVLKHNIGRHIRNVHDRYRNFSCCHCYYSTNSQSDLRRHKQRMHQGSVVSMVSAEVQGPAPAPHPQEEMEWRDMSSFPEGEAYPDLSLEPPRDPPVQVSRPREPALPPRSGRVSAQGANPAEFESPTEVSHPREPALLPRSGSAPAEGASTDEFESPAEVSHPREPALLPRSGSAPTGGASPAEFESPTEVSHPREPALPSRSGSAPAKGASTGESESSVKPPPPREPTLQPGSGGAPDEGAGPVEEASNPQEEPDLPQGTQVPRIVPADVELQRSRLQKLALPSLSTVAPSAPKIDNFLDDILKEEEGYFRLKYHFARKGYHLMQDFELREIKKEVRTRVTHELEEDFVRRQPKAPTKETVTGRWQRAQAQPMSEDWVLPQQQLQVDGRIFTVSTRLTSSDLSILPPRRTRNKPKAAVKPEPEAALFEDFGDRSEIPITLE